MQRVEVVKTGVWCDLLLDMDAYTFTRHMRLNHDQYDRFVRFLDAHGHGNNEHNIQRIPVERKALVFLWYMANQNSFREISDKFNIGQGSAHRIVADVLRDISHFSTQCIKWPNELEKAASSREFLRKCDLDNIHDWGNRWMSHTYYSRPHRHGDDYMNRKGYYSVLLQGVCDHTGKFINIFAGPPGRVHDARLLRSSNLYQSWEDNTIL